MMDSPVMQTSVDFPVGPVFLLERLEFPQTFPKRRSSLHFEGRVAKDWNE